MKSLRNATTTQALCDLEYDNVQIGKGKRWGLLGGEIYVYLSEQPIGATPIQKFEIPRKFFDQLIDLYMAEQATDAVQEKATPKARRKKVGRISGRAARAQAARG